MRYRELNDIHKRRMKGISKNEYEMNFEDPKLMEALLGCMPDLNYAYVKDNELEKVLREKEIELKKELDTYNPFTSNKEIFLSNVQERLKDIHCLYPNWHGVNYFEIEACVRKQGCCLIYGEGGIGKSYFIKKYEEELDKKKIEHLCLYGKFDKSLDDVNVEEINGLEVGFVFVVDAINELTEEGQNRLIEILDEIRRNSRIRVVLTYRTNTLDKPILETVREFVTDEYAFPGVSFESAINRLIQKSVPDIGKYADVLYSNNALLLNMLYEILSDIKIVDVTENGVASITFILESYIKKSVNRSFSKLQKHTGKEIWKMTKYVAAWMYDNNSDTIAEQKLYELVDCEYVDIMKELGFISSYEHDGNMFFVFTIETMFNYLIVRHLFQCIADMRYEEIVKIIKEKNNKFGNIGEQLIVAIFDKFAPEYEYIKKLLVDTDLFRVFGYETILKINFKKEHIQSFQRIFTPSNINEVMIVAGGYVDKPFNCENYLMQCYKGNFNNIIALSKKLSGVHFLGEIKRHLKNMLYFTAISEDVDISRTNEAMCFSLLCCAAPNKEIRYLAIRLLYDIVDLDYRYAERIMEEYSLFYDDYIREAIIFVLSKGKKYRSVEKFLYNLSRNDDTLCARSIRRIAAYLGDKNNYIFWNRNNLYSDNKGYEISEYLRKILFTVDIYNKDWLPFNYWGFETRLGGSKFLGTNKKQIANINQELRKRYSCVKEGECKGRNTFKDMILNEIGGLSEVELMDNKAFLYSYEKVLRGCFERYKLNADYSKEEYYGDFANSLYMKIVDIATGIYYGSLMCNYYSDEFATYNNLQCSIGYEVYDPLEYEEELSLTTPLPIYCDKVDFLDECLCDLIALPDEKNQDWGRDLELTRANILGLLQPIVYKGEWVLLGASVTLRGDKIDGWELTWLDNYDIWCCTSDSETIVEDGNARKLTIELEDYNGRLSDYRDLKYKPWLCKRKRSIFYNSDIFDRTSLVLPPADIIKYFDLVFDRKMITWVDPKGEVVIICNNNRNSYYEDVVSGSIYMNRQYWEQYKREKTLKYFAFAERFVSGDGYDDATSLHFEINNGRIEKEIRNNSFKERIEEINPKCIKCEKFKKFNSILETQYQIKWIDDVSL